MRPLRLCVRAFVLWTLVLGCAPPRQNAELILHGGAVYTMNPAQPRVQAIAIDGGRIVALGSDDEIARAYRSKVDVDLKGQMVLPGFHDAHVHPVYGGIELGQCNLTDLGSIEAITTKVGQCNKDSPGSDWLIGAGWNLSLFPQANPNKELLDAISTERPIFLGGADGHSSWANSKALTLAGIERETPNPHNGIIERNAKGEATGTLRESAQDIVRAVIPPLTAEARRDGLLRALKMANGFGITSFVEAAAGSEELAAYRALESQGELTARVVASIAVTNADADALMNPQDRGSDAKLRTDSAKIFVDGVLEGETAALLAPYLDHPGFSGNLKTSPEELTARVVALDRRGIQVHMHAIGDRAVRVALDAVEAARRANGPSDNRHHIAHLQMVDPLDRPRFAQLGVIANFQALWAFPDLYITDVNLPQVGQARVDQMYPIGDVLRAGGRIVGGSDWSVSSMNPLLAIETAITRSDPTGRMEGVLNESERVSLPDMLAAYTINGAYLMHQEKLTGSLEVGKAADLVVLERDLFEIPPEEIGEVAVTRTIFGGATVYSR
jgi:predicted amidohydrolase YtcJ